MIKFGELFSKFDDYFIEFVQHDPAQSTFIEFSKYRPSNNNNSAFEELIFSATSLRPVFQVFLSIVNGGRVLAVAILTEYRDSFNTKVVKKFTDGQCLIRLADNGANLE